MASVRSLNMTGRCFLCRQLILSENDTDIPMCMLLGHGHEAVCFIFSFNGI